MDIDPAAVAAARRRLPHADITLADTLTRPPERHFDVVVGNPPYLSQLARRTSRGGRSALGGGPYADTAALFLTLAARMTRPGGRFALVLAQSILASRDTAPIRHEVLAGSAMRSLWVAGCSMFDASVHTVIASFERGGVAGPVERYVGADFEPIADGAPPTAGSPTWSSLLADVVGVPPVTLNASRTIGNLATATADFRDQYYGLVGFVGDEIDGPPLVTSGLIDVGRCAWGERPVRFAKAVYRAPRVAVPPALAAWAKARLVPKVLVATQTPVVEAVVDATGAWLPSVPVISVIPRQPDKVWHVGAVLCAPAVSAWAAATYLGAGMTTTAIKLSASQVATIPIPLQQGNWDDAAAALRDCDIIACANAMQDAYEVDDPALWQWWSSRAKLTPNERPPAG